MEKESEHKPTMVEIDQETKALLNDIKSILLKKDRNETQASWKSSYRAIVKNAIKELHEKLNTNTP